MAKPEQKKKKKMWTQRVFDQFTDAQFTALTAHTPDQGLTYVNVDTLGLTGWQIDVTGTKAQPAFAGGLTLNTTTLLPDQAASVVMLANVSLGILARASGGDGTWSGYAAEYDEFGLQLQLFRYDDGVATQLGSNVPFTTWASGMVLRIECEDQTIRLLVDGVVYISQQDSVYPSGSIGLQDPPHGGMLVDDFRGFDQESERPVQGSVG